MELYTLVSFDSLPVNAVFLQIQKVQYLSDETGFRRMADIRQTFTKIANDGESANAYNGNNTVHFYSDETVFLLSLPVSSDSVE